MEYEENSVFDDEEEALTPGSSSFRVLRNAKDFDDVLQHAGLASRLASDRILDEEERLNDVSEDNGVLYNKEKKIEDEMNEEISIKTRNKKQKLNRLDSSSAQEGLSGGIRTASAVSSMQMMNHLRMPKAPRDVIYAIIFFMHIFISLFIIIMRIKKDMKQSGFIKWLWLQNNEWLWTSSILSCLIVSIFIVFIFIYDPRETRRVIWEIAFPVAMVALILLLFIYFVLPIFDYRGSTIILSYKSSDSIFVGVLTIIIPFMIGTINVFYIKKMIHNHQNEPFFDAMLALCNRALKDTYKFIIKLIFCSIALHSFWLCLITATWASFRSAQCTKNASHILFLFEFCLIFHLYWFSNTIRCFLRGVISGCVLHYFLKLQKERIAQLDNQFLLFTRDTQNDQTNNLDDLFITDSTPELVDDIHATTNPLRYRRRHEIEHYEISTKMRYPLPSNELGYKKSAQYHFLRLFLGISLGTIVKSALVGPPIRLLYSVIFYNQKIYSAILFCTTSSNNTSIQSRQPWLNFRRDLYLAHAAAFNKASSAAARDLSLLALDSGLDQLLDTDTIIPILKSYRYSLSIILAALWTTLTLLDRHLIKDPRFDCEDKDALFAHFILAYLSIALATEPLIAAIEVAYLAFVQIPLGLMQADPIIYQRFQRLLLRRERHSTPTSIRNNINLHHHTDCTQVEEDNYDDDGGDDDDDNVGLLSSRSEGGTNEVHL